MWKWPSIEGMHPLIGLCMRKWRVLQTGSWTIGILFLTSSHPAFGSQWPLSYLGRSEGRRHRELPETILLQSESLPTKTFPSIVKLWRHIMYHQTITIKEGRQVFLLQKAAHSTVFHAIHRDRKLVVRVFKLPNYPSQCNWNAEKRSQGLRVLELAETEGHWHLSLIFQLFFTNNVVFVF